MADIVIESLGPLWTLAEVKAHLRVDHYDDDALIQSYMDAAEIALLTFCNLALVPLGREPVFKHAGFLTVASFYSNREEAGIPSSAQSLIWPCRRMA